MEADVKYLAVGFAVWLMSLVVLTSIFALFLTKDGLSIQMIAYSSSAISFASAFFGGAAAYCVRKCKRLSSGLILGTALTIFLLTVGFLAEGSKISASAVISAASFSISGSMAGAVFMPNRLCNQKKKRLQKS